MNIVAYNPTNNIVFRSKSNVERPRISTNQVDTVSLQGPESRVVSLKRVLSLTKNGVLDTPVDKELLKDVSPKDWLQTYYLAVQNGVVGHVSDALKKNPDIEVPQEITEHMDKMVSFIERTHKKQEHTLNVLNKLTDANGIDTVQMKGIGLSMLYPEPQHRFSSDIDVFNIIRGENPSDGVKKASFLVDNIAQDAGLGLDTTHGLKHSVLQYKDVMIENHRTFLNANSYDFAKQMDDYLLKHINPVEKTLPHGTKILVPSNEFNTVFLSFHTMQHYLNGDTNARQLTDWTMHIHKNGLKIPEEVKGTPLEKFIYALTNVSNKYFGTNIEVPENKKIEDEIVKQFLNPAKVSKPKSSSVKDIFMFKFDSLSRREARKKELLGEGSVFKGLISSLNAHRSLKSIIGVFTRY